MPPTPRRDLRTARRDAPGSLVRTRHGEVHAVVEGSGPPLVLVHGVTENALTFFDLQASLAHAMTVHAIDLPGHGLTDFPARTLDLGEMARWVDGYMEAARVERAVVVGWSMGGGVALELAIQRPGRVGALVLLGTIGAAMPLPLSLGLLRHRGVAEVMMRLSGSPTMRRELLRDAVHGSFTHQDATLDRYWDGWRVLGRAPYVRRLLRSLDVSPLEARLGQVAAPTILLHGDADRLVPLAVARTIASKLRAAELRVLRETGHSPHLEEPGAVRAAIRDAVRLSSDAARQPAVGRIR